MILASENVVNRRQMYIMYIYGTWMYQSNCNLLKRLRNCFYVVHKWLDDVEVEQVVLNI